VLEVDSVSRCTSFTPQFRSSRVRFSACLRPDGGRPLRTVRASCSVSIPVSAANPAQWRPTRLKPHRPARIRRGLRSSPKDPRPKACAWKRRLPTTSPSFHSATSAGGPFHLIDGRAGAEAVRTMRAAVRLRLAPTMPNRSGHSVAATNRRWFLWQMAPGQIQRADSRQPTRGIDVGARFEVYQLIHGLADGGGAF